MAAPLQTGKQSVDLASGGVRASRIRRDPPPVQKKAAQIDPEEREARIVVIGVVAFALAIAGVVIGVSTNLGNGEPPREKTVQLEL